MELRCCSGKCDLEFSDFLHLIASSLQRCGCSLVAIFLTTAAVESVQCDKCQSHDLKRGGLNWLLISSMLLLRMGLHSVR